MSDEVGDALATIAEAYAFTLAKWGWIQGSIGHEKMGFCMWGAWRKATGSQGYWLNSYFRASAGKVIEDLFPDRAGSIECFNDNKLTSQEDVLLAGKHAITGIADVIRERAEASAQYGEPPGQ